MLTPPKENVVYEHARFGDGDKAIYAETNAQPWPEGLQLVRIPLPQPSEPRRIGTVWSRSTVRIRLVTVLLAESRAAMTTKSRVST